MCFSSFNSSQHFGFMSLCVCFLLFCFKLFSDLLSSHPPFSCALKFLVFVYLFVLLYGCWNFRLSCLRLSIYQKSGTKKVLFFSYLCLFVFFLFRSCEDLLQCHAHKPTRINARFGSVYDGLNWLVRAQPFWLNGNKNKLLFWKNCIFFFFFDGSFTFVRFLCNVEANWVFFFNWNHFRKLPGWVRWFS